MDENLSIFQLNDLHGYLESHQELFWRDGEEVYKKCGGLAEIKYFIDEKRKKGPILFLDNGDTFHGTFVSVNNEAKEMTSLMNEIGPDAMTLHWEFAYGPERVEEINGELEYPILAINCYSEGNDERIFDPYSVFTRNGIKIGVIGIAATIVDKTMPDSFSEGIYFTLGNEELPFFVNELREKKNVDLVVVLSHLGFPQDVELAKEVDGIDVLLSGHTHNRLYKEAVVNDTIIYQSGCHGSFLGKLDLIEIEKGRIGKYNHSLLTIDEKLQKDEKVSKKIDKIKEPYRDYLSKKIGKTKSSLHRYHVMESKMDNLLLEACREVGGTNLAFSNGWRYGALIPPNSEIIMEDLWQIVPANPSISTCILKGKEIWEMMEDNLENTFSREPYQQMGGYVKRCIGLNIYFKVENPKNERIQEIYVGNEDLKQKKEYPVTYLSSQAVPREYGKEKKELDIKAIEALKKYIKNNTPIEITKNNSIVPI